jgi:hypothetical protein
MKIHRLVPSFDSRSTQARIYKAHDALGSRMRDVAHARKHLYPSQSGFAI